jgi:hypothetical protein
MCSSVTELRGFFGAVGWASGRWGVRWVKLRERARRVYELCVCMYDAHCGLCSVALLVALVVRASGGLSSLKTAF